MCALNSDEKKQHSNFIHTMLILPLFSVSLPLDSLRSLLVLFFIMKRMMQLDVYFPVQFQVFMSNSGLFTEFFNFFFIILWLVLFTFEGDRVSEITLYQFGSEWVREGVHVSFITFSFEQICIWLPNRSLTGQVMAPTQHHNSLSAACLVN